MKFKCDNCAQLFELTEGEQALQARRACQNCHLEQWVNILERNSNYSVIESLGCSYQAQTEQSADDDQLLNQLMGEDYCLSTTEELSSEIDWDEVEELTGAAIRYESTDELSDPFVASELGSWVVISKNRNKKYNFHYLAVIRKWILDGVLKPEDRLQLADGKSVALIDYAPLSELFDKEKSERLRKKYLQQLQQLKINRQLRKQIKEREKEKKKKPWSLYITSLFLIFVAGYFGWQHYQEYRLLTAAKLALETTLVGIEKPQLQREEIIKRSKEVISRSEASQSLLIEKQLAGLLSQRKDDAKLLALLSLVYSLAGEAENSLSYNQRAKSLAYLAVNYDRQIMLSHLALARSCWQLAQVSCSKKELAKISQLKSKDPFSYYLLGKLQLDMGQQDAGLLSLNIAHNYQGDDLALGLEIANRYIELHKLDNALALLEKNIALNAEHWPSLELFAKIQRQQGNLLLAKLNYRRLIAAKYNLANSYFALASIAAEEKDYRKVLDIAAEYDKAFPLGGTKDKEFSALVSKVSLKEDELQRVKNIKKRLQERKERVAKRRWGAKKKK